MLKRHGHAFSKCSGLKAQFILLQEALWLATAFLHQWVNGQNKELKRQLGYYFFGVKETEAIILALLTYIGGKRIVERGLAWGLQHPVRQLAHLIDSGEAQHNQRRVFLAIEEIMSILSMTGNSKFEI